MNSEFLPEADEEFREAVWYYEYEAPGVGLSFVAEVRRGVTFITKNPFAVTEIGGGIRKKVLNHLDNLFWEPGGFDKKRPHEEV